VCRLEIENSANVNSHRDRVNQLAEHDWTDSCKCMQAPDSSLIRPLVEVMSAAAPSMMRAVVAGNPTYLIPVDRCGQRPDHSRVSWGIRDERFPSAEYVSARIRSTGVSQISSINSRKLPSCRKSELVPDSPSCLPTSPQTCPSYVLIGLP
jgi:hypothetical protein